MPADAYEGLTETQTVLRRRFREARAAGLTRIESRLFAESEEDVRVLRLLVSHGATPQQIARVVL